MKRNCSLDEISDGKFYTSNELAELSCNGCKGAASCCHGMGNSIILDPYDIYRLTTNLNVTLEGLLAEKIELNIFDGVILPNLKMTGDFESCAFLDKDGKCTIHALRPGICRIFPLGRYYENGDFSYILQVEECKNNSRTKMKISKWIDTPELEKNEQFLKDWHYFINEIERIINNTSDEKLIKNLTMYILNRFYVKQYESSVDFYQQFYQRLSEARNMIQQ